MNKTKKLTTGAMLLAIVGALMLINRQLSYMFEELIIMMAPVVIIIYSSMYDLKDGAILSISLLILGFLLGSTYSYMYLPISVIVGMGYSFGIKKNFDKKKLLIIAIALFLLGEVVITFVVSPLLGIDIASQVQEMKTIYTDLMAKSGLGSDPMAQYGINLNSLILVSLVLSTILIGIMEGLIIHILSMFLLYRFKIKTFNSGSVLSFNLNPVVAYLCFIATFGLYFINKVDNETVKLVIITLAMVGMIVLVYYGYLFVVMYMKLKTGKKSVSFIIVLVIIFTMPLSLIILTILGFLYGAGPLKNLLLDKGKGNQ